MEYLNAKRIGHILTETITTAVDKPELFEEHNGELAAQLGRLSDESTAAATLLSVGDGLTFRVRVLVEEMPTDPSADEG